jgi:hypothetical protein
MTELWDDDAPEPLPCYACRQATRGRDEDGRPMCLRCHDERDDARSYEIASGGR